MLQRGTLRAAAIALLAALLSLAPHAQPSTIVGALEAESVPGLETAVAIMMPMPTPPPAGGELAAVVPADAAWYASIVPAFGGQYRPRLLMAHLADDSHVVFTDLDGDGQVAASERMVFAAGDDRPVVAHFHVPGWRQKSYAVALSSPGPLRRQDGTLGVGSTARSLTVSTEVVARGSVTVNGRGVAFYLGLDPATGMPSATTGRQFMDTNGDGSIDTDYRSPETFWVRGAAPVFRVDTTYLSVQAIDPVSHHVTFRLRPAADYERFELTAGRVLPDFAFVDFDGRARKLSDFRGKFVLLDFWGTWCGPCVAEQPVLKRALAQFHARGFEVIGMNSEHPDKTPADLAAGVEKARAFVAEHGLTWPQARQSSIQTLTLRSFAVETWPTAVLIDPDGRIVSTDRKKIGEPGLRGADLEATLDKLMRSATYR